MKKKIFKIIYLHLTSACASLEKRFSYSEAKLTILIIMNKILNLIFEIYLNLNRNIVNFTNFEKIREILNQI